MQTAIRLVVLKTPPELTDSRAMVDRWLNHGRAAGIKKIVVYPEARGTASWAPGLIWQKRESTAGVRDPTNTFYCGTWITGPTCCTMKVVVLPRKLEFRGNGSLIGRTSFGRGVCPRISCIEARVRAEVHHHASGFAMIVCRVEC